MKSIENKLTQIWICNRCTSIFDKCWLLKRHIQLTHKVSSNEASYETRLSEWLRIYNPELLTSSQNNE